jgi:molybdopterin converting factor small subunit
MTIRVELFGIARQRAGTAVIRIPAEGPRRLDELLRGLAADYPLWADECLDGNCLRSSYLANLNGERFVRDPSTRISPGDELLIMSADAGG